MWDVVTKLDPTSLARIVCGRHWVDEGFLKQQLVFDPRVFFPPSPSACLPSSSTASSSTSKHNNNNHHHHHHHPDTTTPPVNIDAVPTITDPPPILPSLAPHQEDDTSHSSTASSSASSASVPPPTPAARHPTSLTSLPPLSRNTAVYLHRVLDEWADARDRDRLAKFMYLCTNCVYIPWGGLGDGVFVVKSEDGAPHPHGSCNMLHLPEKNSYEAFREMLEEMVNRLDLWIHQLV